MLTDWNGLMIAAMARAGRVLDCDDSRAAATRAADFVLRELRTADGKLLKRWRQGQAGLPAHLEDYAFLVWGLLELHQATRDPRWLREAVALNQRMIDDFSDDKSGGFFMTAEGGEKLIVRSKKLYGGAIPSGNAVAALNLLRLARLTGDTTLEERHEKLLRGFAGEIGRHPSAFPQLLQSIDFAAGPSHEIVITGQPGADDTTAMLRALDQRFLPNAVVVFRPAGEAPPITDLAPYTRDQRAARRQGHRLRLPQLRLQQADHLDRGDARHAEVVRHGPMPARNGDAPPNIRQASTKLQDGRDRWQAGTVAAGTAFRTVRRLTGRISHPIRIDLAAPLHPFLQTINPRRTPRKGVPAPPLTPPARFSTARFSAARFSRTCRSASTFMK